MKIVLNYKRGKQDQGAHGRAVPLPISQMKAVARFGACAWGCITVAVQARKTYKLPAVNSQARKKSSTKRYLEILLQCKYNKL